MKSLLKYLIFFTQSTNQHGVHSPFIFNLLTNCFYKKTVLKKWKKFKKIKFHLLRNKDYIKVTDFGSGSKIFKSNKRQIAKIAKIAGISNKKAQLLIRLINYFKPKEILEIGTSLGLATSAIKIGNQNATITTLEGCKETAKVAQNTFKKNEFEDIFIFTGNFSETIPKVTNQQKFDCIYFDGNHTKKATLDYFKICLPTIHNDTFWVFDDIYWNSDMQQAWNEIKNHPKVTVTVNIFYWGIVFFRKEQEKEHFKIRV